MKDVKELKVEWLEAYLCKPQADMSAREIISGLEDVEIAYWEKMEEMNEQTHIGEDYVR